MAGHIQGEKKSGGSTLFPKAPEIKDHDLGDLKQLRFSALQHWKLPSPKTRHQQGGSHSLSHTHGGTPPGLFLVAGGSWQALPFFCLQAIHCKSTPSDGFLPVSLYTIFLLQHVCLYVQMFPCSQSISHHRGPL